MTIINRKRAYKTIGLQLALIVAILLSRATMLFFHDYRLLVFEKKDQSTWVGIAEQKEGELYACQKDLEQAKADKQAAVAANNADIMQPIKN